MKGTILIIRLLLVIWSEQSHCLRKLDVTDEDLWRDCIEFIKKEG